ncbi:uncharacterized protein LOC132269439 [Cornus florida]|uniref:uncharacterized protein LOC132269439 n=1 Tax=Cornus florida TaxID=4283 RepID=UPI00289CD7CD|nr:uncharacterized protein LOC132269439 [Cornus florida]
MWGQEHRAPVAVDGGRMDWGLRNWLDGGGGGQLGGFSHESEHDLAAMVTDFLENGSCGAESCPSSDSDSGFSDIASIPDKISLYKHSVDQYERDLLSVVHSLILSINEMDYHLNKSDTCNASCIRFSLVKLLRSSGYDAAVCATKWQGFGKIPGGEHEFIEVIIHRGGGCSERYIIDLDFQSHFEIARAVESYDAVLNSLPAVYVGSLSKLKQLLQAMVDAAKYSLKQNSMPLPPWRSLAYLEAKWESHSQRVASVYERSNNSTCSSGHQHCIRLLRRLKSCIRSEIKAEGLLLYAKNDKKGRLKTDRWKYSSFRTL